MKAPWRLALVTIALVACGDNYNPVGQPDADSGIDAQNLPHKWCWKDFYAYGGTLALGTGQPFMQMPDPLPTHYGTQNGFDIPVNARITGLQPGNPSDPLDLANPHTRFRAYYVDTGAPIATGGSCGISVGYAPSSTTPGAYELALPSAIEFPVGLPESEIFGRQVYVLAEIIDAAGYYAVEEKLVTLAPPPGWTM
jgi:hypothetical protein